MKQSRPGDVIVSNSDWHEAQLNEHRLPYRADLDAVSPANPVVLVRGGHEYILNSAALRKWNITKETPQQPGGRITRDAKGELNGELIDRAKALVQLPPSPPLTIEALVEQHKKLNAAGLTSIRYPGASIEQYRLLEEMKRRGLLTIRVSQLMRVPRRQRREDARGGRRAQRQAGRRRRVAARRRHEARRRRRLRRRLDARSRTSSRGAKAAPSTASTR